MTTVVKVKRRPVNNFTLYIGRSWAGLPASKWGNPFNARTQGLEICLVQYEAYVRSTPYLMAALHEIDNQVLGCWCHEVPSDGSVIKCHGDVLIKLRKEQIAANKTQSTTEGESTGA